MAKKKSSTTGVIDITAMGKAGQMTGLQTSKQSESDTPNIVKQIGNFALRQYFNAVEHQRKARVNHRKIFNPLLDKTRDLGDTGAVSRIEALAEDYKAQNRILNNPINMLIPFTKKYRDAEIRKDQIERSLLSIENSSKLRTEMIENVSLIINGDKKNEKGDKIGFASQSTSSQILHSSALASGAITDATIYLPNEDGVEEAFVVLSLTDWDPNTPEVDGSIPSVYENSGIVKSVDHDNNKSTPEIKVVKFDDMIANEFFAGESQVVTRDHYNTFIENAANLGYSEMMLDMNSTKGVSVRKTFYEQVDNWSNHDLGDEFFGGEITIDGVTKTYAAHFMEGIDKTLTITDASGNEIIINEKYYGMLEGMKADFAKNPEKYRQLVKNLSLVAADQNNISATVEREAYNKSKKSPKFSWTQANRVRDDIMDIVNANSGSYIDNNGHTWEWDSTIKKFKNPNYGIKEAKGLLKSDTHIDYYTYTLRKTPNWGKPRP
tara:strand:+ start:4649 stop:6124 length:1476 start_codon:yes stop_codon:yes gene_type:complete